MAKLWTLKKPFEDKRSVLNGKIFQIRVRDNKMYFIDVQPDGKVLWASTRIVTREPKNNEITICTESGAEYQLVDALSLIPTCVVNDNPNPETVYITPTGARLSAIMNKEHMDEDDPDNITMDDLEINKTRIYRMIEYGDGYDGYVYTFNKKITYDQFLDICKKGKRKLDKLDGYAWYEDHAKVTPTAIPNNARHGEYPDGKPGDSSMIWTYLWVRAYTD